MVRARYETQRLRLTLAEPSLANRVADYYSRNRLFLAPFEPVRDEAFFTEADQRRRLEAEAAEAIADRSYRFYLSLRERPEEIIGLSALGNLVRGAFQSCFLSYKLDGRLLNRGYMTEALAETLRIAFSDLDLHRVEANIMPRNRASLRAAEKAGLQNEGLAVRYLQIDGVWEDHIHMVRRNE